MRIVHILNRTTIDNGVVRLLLDIIPHQLSQGHVVDVIALVDHPNSCGEKFIQLGCNYKCLASSSTNLKSPIFILKLLKVLNDYEIIHAHLFPVLYWVAISKIIFRSQTKLVFTEHATENNRRKWWLRHIERFIYKQYDLITAISESVAENLMVHLQCSKKRICTIENGVNIERFKEQNNLSKTELNIPDNSIVIIQVAGFRPEKDQMTTIRAISLLPDNYHLLLVGDGIEINKHIHECHKLDITNRVHFLGTRDDIPALLRLSDIVVMSSYFEGFGLAAVEGMAAMKPVIASNVKGLSEVVKDVGILFERGNYNELSENILKIMRSQNYYNLVVNRCYKRALKYDIANVANKYNELYYKL